LKLKLNMRRKLLITKECDGHYSLSISLSVKKNEAIELKIPDFLSTSSVVVTGCVATVAT